MRSFVRLYAVMCCAVLLAAFANAQEKSNNNEPATAATNDGSAQPSSPQPIRTLWGDPVYKVGEGVTPPRIVKSQPPEYSKSAKEEGIEGTVLLWLIVNSQGFPEQVKVQKALGHGLDQKAVDAVRRWKFAPATKDGAPVAVMINVEVNFKLY